MRNPGLDVSDRTVVAYCTEPRCPWREIRFDTATALDALAEHLYETHGNHRGRERIAKQKARAGV